MDGNWIEHYDGAGTAAGNGGFYGTSAAATFLFLVVVVAFCGCF